MKPPPYSKLPVRQRIVHDIASTEKLIDFYREISHDGSHDEKLAELAAQKNRLLEDAAHYDREQELGYRHPTTHRWRKK